MAEIHSSWKRDFDVYDRLNALGIDLGTKADAISDPRGRRICNLTFTPSGLVFASGTGAGTGPVTNDDQDVEDGYQAGREAGISHILSLHWGLEPFGNLNDVWYCVKCIGMVNSHGGGSFSKSPQVVDGYTKAFHDVLADRYPNRLKMAWTHRYRVGMREVPWQASTYQDTARLSLR